MDSLYRLSSSLRIVPAEETLARARGMAPRAGISRVTDITRLDRVGIPVCASVRPRAREGSLCVNAGKGMTLVEARVGAYMEALEYAFAEFGASSVPAVARTARDVLDGQDRPDAILDFCPIVGMDIDLDEPLACVEAEDVVTTQSCLVPAELVFHPFDDALGLAYFSTSTNGLASGNSVLEATVHGLAEVIERDLRSFQTIRDTSSLVEPESLPPILRPVLEALEAADLQLVLKYMKNAFDLPYFSAAIAEAGPIDPIYVSGGYACHPLKDIAATRAICEAIQSRLSFIHGARDDLVDHYARFAGMDVQARAAYAQQVVRELTAAPSVVTFSAVPDHPKALAGLESALDVLLAALESVGLHRVCRVTFTTPEHPLQVVRILVPGLEFFTSSAPRFGFRLREYVAQS